LKWESTEYRADIAVSSNCRAAVFAFFTPRTRATCLRAVGTRARRWVYLVCATNGPRKPGPQRQHRVDARSTFELRLPARSAGRALFPHHSRCGRARSSLLLGLF